MSQSLQRRDEDADVAALLEEAERLIGRASQEIDDPYDRNRLKEAEFTLWKIRAERYG